jgi:hypothetical protein
MKSSRFTTYDLRNYRAAGASCRLKSDQLSGKIRCTKGLAFNSQLGKHINFEMSSLVSGGFMASSCEENDNQFTRTIVHHLILPQ